MTVMEAAEIVMGVNEALKSSLTPKQARRLSKLKHILNAEYEAYVESQKQVITRRTEILKKYAEKNEEGNPVMENTDQGKGYKIENVTDCNAELEQVVKPLEDELEDIGKEELEVTFKKLDIDELPDDISGTAIDLLRPIIDDDEEISVSKKSDKTE